MKARTNLLAVAAVASLSLLPVVANAQTSVTTTTTSPVVTGSTTTTTASSNLEGTITSFTPASSQIVVRGSAGSPVTYSYSKTTTFVDADGNTVSAESIQPGAPTTVYYATENGQPVVSKVVVRRTTAPATVVVPATTTRTESSETTTTTRRK